MAWHKTDWEKKAKNIHSPQPRPRSGFVMSAVVVLCRRISVERGKQKTPSIKYAYFFFSPLLVYLFLLLQSVYRVSCPGLFHADRHLFSFLFAPAFHGDNHQLPFLLPPFGVPVFFRFTCFSVIKMKGDVDTGCTKLPPLKAVIPDFLISRRPDIHIVVAEKEKEDQSV